MLDTRTFMQVPWQRGGPFCAHEQRVWCAVQRTGNHALLWCGAQCSEQVTMPCYGVVRSAADRCSWHPHKLGAGTLGIFCKHLERLRVHYVGRPLWGMITLCVCNYDHTKVYQHNEPSICNYDHYPHVVVAVFGSSFI